MYVTRARPRLRCVFDETADPLLSLLHGHAGSNYDHRAHLQDIMERTPQSLQKDASIAVRAMRNAFNAIDTLMGELWTMARRSEALERRFAVWSRDLVTTMTGRLHSLTRNDEDS